MMRTYISDLIAYLTVAAGIIAIGGWFTDAQSVSAIIASIASTKFNSSLCLIFCAVALYAVNRPGENLFWKRSGIIGSYAVIIIASLTLLEYLTGMPLSLDRWFVKTSLKPVTGAIELIACLMFFCIGLIFLKLRSSGSHILVQILLPGIFFVAVFITFNYISGLGYLDSMPFAVNTALTTSLGIMLLSVGIFFSRPLSSLTFSFERKIASYFAVAILLLGIVFFSISTNNAKLLNSARMVDHTKEVLLQTSLILTEAQDLETGARGFIITGNEQFLEPFTRSKDQILHSIAQLKRLTANVRVQQVRCDTMFSLAQQNILLRSNLIELKKSGLTEPLMTIMSIGAEKELTDKIREVISQIKATEQNSLQIRILENEKTARGSQRIITAIQIIVTILLVAVCVFIYRNTLFRNKAEAALRKSELFARSIIDNASSAISIKDLQGRYLLANTQVQKLFNTPEKDILGKTATDFDPQLRPELAESEDEVVRTRKPQEVSFKLNTVSGLKHMITTRFPLFDEKNEIYAICSMSTDITLIREAQEQVEKAHKQQQLILNGLQNLLEASLDIICVIDKEGVFSQVTANCLDLLGYTSEDMIGQHYTSFMVVSDIEYSQSRLHEIMSGTRIRDCENRYYRKDGSVVPLLWTVIWMPENETFYAIIKDATEKKLTAQQLRELNAQLSRRASELLASNTELEQFAYVASHDLQEPLRMVSSFLQLLEKKLDGSLDETGKKYISFATDGAERMKILIQDLLQYSRIGTSKELVVSVDCNEVMRTMRNIYELTINETQTELVIHPMPVIKAERGQIHQLFQNLIGNAIKYSLPGIPKIIVGCDEHTDHWLFYVKDQGVGINPKFFDKIFVIFQRLHNRSEYTGTGIGLAICKKIVERHGGKIWVESEAGQGSTFFVTLPKY